MKQLLTILFIIFIIFPSIGGEIKGEIFPLQTSPRFGNTKIKLIKLEDSSAHYTYLNVTRKFSFKNLLPGHYTIKFLIEAQDFDNYALEIFNIVLNNDTVINLPVNVYLQRSVIGPCYASGVYKGSRKKALLKELKLRSRPRISHGYHENGHFTLIPINIKISKKKYIKKILVKTGKWKNFYYKTYMEIEYYDSIQYVNYYKDKIIDLSRNNNHTTPNIEDFDLKTGNFKSYNEYGQKSLEKINEIEISFLYEDETQIDHLYSVIKYKLDPVRVISLDHKNLLQFNKFVEIHSK